MHKELPQGMPELNLTDLDRRIWDEELVDFVPSRIYDVHAHTYDMRSDATGQPCTVIPQPFDEWPLANWDILNYIDELLLPGREVHRFCFGNPLQECPLKRANTFTAQEVSNDPQSVSLMLVRPPLSAEELVSQARRYGFSGLKPYRMHSLTGDAVNCRITDYLPEEQIEVANSLGMVVMLHLSKPKAVADQDNLNDLERLANKFPDVKWILAHCARSYYDFPLLEARDRLVNIPNLWYDISSVCDSDAMVALLSIAGVERVMYGSDDAPVGITRGKYITFGHSWSERNQGNHKLNLSHCDGRMTFVRYESLRALRRALARYDYGKEEHEKIFFSNAKHLAQSVTCHKST